MAGPPANTGTGRPYGIRAKVVVAILIATVPMTATFWYLGLTATTRLVRTQGQRDLTESAAAQADDLHDAIAAAVAAADHLGRSAAVRRFASACAGPGGPSRQDREALRDEFTLVGETAQLDSELWFVDARGRGREGLVFADRRLTVVPEQRLGPSLRHQSPRPGIALDLPGVTLWPLDLARTDGRPQQPLRPVARVAVTITDDRGALGVLVLAMNLGPLMPTRAPDGGFAFLADSDGWFLAHTRPEKAWGAPSDLNTGFNLHREFGASTAALLRPQGAAVETAGWVVATAPVTLDAKPGIVPLFVGLEAPERVLFAELLQYRPFFWALLAVGFIVPILLGLGLTAHFLRPLGKLRDAVHSVAEGDLDATARVDSRDEFQQLADDLNVMAARLREYQRQERQALVGRMAAGIIHDIKNPLAAIRVYAQVLGDPDLPEGDRREASDHTTAEVGRILGMLQELLDFSRGEEARLQKRLMTFEELVERLRPLTEASCSQRGIALVLDLAEPCAIEVDPAKLLRALGNLVTNACEAMVREGTLTIRSACVDDGLLVEVADTGPGIPDEVADALFEPFATHGKPGGTGLGLAIARAIVEAHGGRLTARNRPDGATFSVWLPRTAT